jgi:hypothetical protein
MHIKPERQDKIEKSWASYALLNATNIILDLLVLFVGGKQNIQL